MEVDRRRPRLAVLRDRVNENHAAVAAVRHTRVHRKFVKLSGDKAADKLQTEYDGAQEVKECADVRAAC